MGNKGGEKREWKVRQKRTGEKSKDENKQKERWGLRGGRENAEEGD